MTVNLVHIIKLNINSEVINNNIKINNKEDNKERDSLTPNKEKEKELKNMNNIAENVEFLFENLDFIYEIIYYLLLNIYMVKIKYILKLNKLYK